MPPNLDFSVYQVVIPVGSAPNSTAGATCKAAPGLLRAPAFNASICCVDQRRCKFGHSLDLHVAALE